MQIKILEKQDLPLVMAAISQLGWSISSEDYEKHILEQLKNNNPFWIMLDGENFVGHILLKMQSEYKYFADNNIPEIANLAIMPNYLRHGYATKLMDVAEQEAKTKFNVVGLGVGLYKDYGPAQQLYMKRGYKLDGNGITYGATQVVPGTMVMVDDDLLIWLVKVL